MLKLFMQLIKIVVKLTTMVVLFTLFSPVILIGFLFDNTGHWFQTGRLYSDKLMGWCVNEDEDEQ